MAFLEFKGESSLDLSLSLSCGNRNPYELFCNPIADTLCCNSEYVFGENEGVDTREKDFLRCIETKTDSEILLHPCNSPTFVDCSLSIGIPRSSASLPSEGMLKKNKRNGNCRRGNVTKIRKTPNSNKNNQWRKSCRKSSATFPTPTALRLMSASSVTVKECSKCLTTTTPLWRKGPNGHKSLCNACGIRYGKEVRKALSTAAVLFKDNNPPN